MYSAYCWSFNLIRCRFAAIRTLFNSQLVLNWCPVWSISPIQCITWSVYSGFLQFMPCRVCVLIESGVRVIFVNVWTVLNAYCGMFDFHTICSLVYAMVHLFGLCVWNQTESSVIFVCCAYRGMFISLCCWVFAIQFIPSCTCFQFKCNICGTRDQTMYRIKSYIYIVLLKTYFSEALPTCRHCQRTKS